MTQYITTKDLMQQYKVSRTTIHNWIKKGMPIHKLGTSARFVETEVDSWINKNIKKTEA